MPKSDRTDLAEQLEKNRREIAALQDKLRKHALRVQKESRRVADLVKPEEPAKRK